MKVKAKKKDALYEEIFNRAREVLRGRPPEPQDRRRGRAFTRGFSDLAVFEGDMRLFKLAGDIYGFGRVDIKGDDGIWIVKGRLTDQGKQAVKEMQASGIALRLVSPGGELLNDMLSAVTKPFVVTGNYSIPDEVIDRVLSRGVLFGVDLDPLKVEDFITRLEQIKERLGERTALRAFLTATKGLEEARRPLYMALIKKGWAHTEICGKRGRPGGLLSDDFGALTARK